MIEFYSFNMTCTHPEIDGIIFLDLSSDIYKEVCEIKDWHKDVKLCKFVENNDIENVILYKEIMNETKSR